jgi:hypothetical protein
MKNTKLPTLDVKLQAGSLTLTMRRYEFNHALDCMGLTPAAWGTIPSDEFRHKIKVAGRNFLLTPSEFTKSEQLVKVGKEEITMAKLCEKKVAVIMASLELFAESVGDKDIAY